MSHQLYTYKSVITLTTLPALKSVSVKAEVCVLPSSMGETVELSLASQQIPTSQFAIFKLHLGFLTSGVAHS